MKKNNIVLLSLLFLVVACGKNPSQFRVNENRTSDCPMAFEKNNLCAKITWKTGPSADTESSFELQFSTKDNSGPVKDLSKNLAVFLRMTCCGTIKVPKTTALSTDRYLVEQIKLTPGNWEVHVQIKGPQAEEAVVVVSTDGK